MNDSRPTRQSRGSVADVGALRLGVVPRPDRGSAGKARAAKEQAPLPLCCRSWVAEASHTLRHPR